MYVERPAARHLPSAPGSISGDGAGEGTAEPGTARPTAGRRVRAWLQWLLYAGPVVGFVAAGYAHRWITDDGFIYLRVVQQIRAGNGPVFNSGERVEVFTGTLWVALLTAGDLLTPIRLEWVAVLLGIGCGAAGIVLAMAGARRLAGDGAARPWFLPFGAVVFVALAPVWMFATSGLETGLVFAWLGGCLHVLARWATPPHAPMARSAAALVGLGWLVRPELALFSAAFVTLIVVAHWRDGRRRHSLSLLAAAIALPAAWQLFRMGYYGSLVPNTAIAKEASGSAWDRGWNYLRDFADPYWLWVPALGLAFGGYLPLVPRLRSRRARLVVVILGGGGLLHIAYMVNVGGDYVHARLLLPGCFALCAPVAVIPATRRHIAALAVAAWALAAVVAFRPAQWGPDGRFANLVALPRPSGRVTIDDYGWGDGGPRRNWYQGPALYQQTGLLTFERVDTPVRPDRALPLGVFRGIGIVSYAMGPDFHVLDALGLADPFTAHLESVREGGDVFISIPGHEKPLPAAWQAAMLTPAGTLPDPADFIIAPNEAADPTAGPRFQEHVAWARAALGCPQIVQLRNSANASLTAGRFAANVFRSFTNTRVRIPADPEQAYHQFCGPEVPPEVHAVRDT